MSYHIILKFSCNFKNNKTHSYENLHTKALFTTQNIITIYLQNLKLKYISQKDLHYLLIYNKQNVKLNIHGPYQNYSAEVTSRHC